ncbi:MAG TPA: hypothetical protein VNQ80_08160 [Parapedobacter sp.]|uniref:hypothetical protein n=1 Tax=Parapedobacter sp. TaxID=1958893 RepID=UPI002C57F5D9|nr:hypothetical protein [Parapedobacter sp.]HWK57295.1 hypothetical protein [Parapedobacter sp.]
MIKPYAGADTADFRYRHGKHRALHTGNPAHVRRCPELSGVVLKCPQHIGIYAPECPFIRAVCLVGTWTGLRRDLNGDRKRAGRPSSGQDPPKPHRDTQADYRPSTSGA